MFVGNVVVRDCVRFASANISSSSISDIAGVCVLFRDIIVSTNIYIFCVCFLCVEDSASVFYCYYVHLSLENRVETRAIRQWHANDSGDDDDSCSITHCFTVCCLFLLFLHYMH